MPPSPTDPLLPNVPLGATLVIVSVVAVEVASTVPSLTRTRTLAESGPSPRPMPCSVAAVRVGVTPTASS